MVEREYDKYIYFIHFMQITVNKFSAYQTNYPINAFLWPTHAHSTVWNHSYIVQIPFDKMKFNFENEQNGIEKENIENQFEWAKYRIWYRHRSGMAYGELREAN